VSTFHFVVFLTFTNLQVLKVGWHQRQAQKSQPVLKLVPYCQQQNKAVQKGPADVIGGVLTLQKLCSLQIGNYDVSNIQSSLFQHHFRYLRIYKQLEPFRIA
jgi:hypothetical protein